MNSYKRMTDAELNATFVPAVYQKTIYDIDYRQLWDAGIRVITFDMDDTIQGLEQFEPSKSAVIKFQELRLIGFTLMLVSNNRFENKVKRVASQLGIDYIAKAKKPRLDCFQTVLENCREKCDESLTMKQIAHIGNSIIDDVGGAKPLGITTCLVRSSGIISEVKKPLKKLSPIPTEGKQCREVLYDRRLWRKHHKNHHGDQYYQLHEGVEKQEW